MGLLTWLREPGRRGMLVGQIYGEDAELALEAVDELRARRWLTDASMRGVDLREANLPGANLKEADLKDVLLREANLEKTDLTGANLQEADCELADFTSAKLRDADLRMANFSGAVLFKAILEGADLGNADLSETDLTGANLKKALLDRADLTDAIVTDKQLAQVDTLAHAVLPDGDLYDGRFNLAGDLADAAEAEADPDDPESMADFYGVSLKKYQEGQVWAAENLAKVRGQKKAASSKEEAQAEEPPQDEVEAEEEEEPWLEPWSPGSYLDLMEWPFTKRKFLARYLDDEDNQNVARRMMALLSATLLWLPTFIAVLWDAFRTLSQSSMVTQNERSMLLVVLGAGSIALGLVGWALTIIAIQHRGSRSTPIMGLAIVIPYMFIGTGSLWGGAALAIGCVIALILAYLYGGRSARITIFWVTVLLMNPPVMLVLNVLFRLIGTSDPASVAFRVGFVLLQFLISFAIVMILQYAVRTHILGRVGRRKDTPIIRNLEWGYLIIIVLLIGRVVSYVLLLGLM